MGRTVYIEIESGKPILWTEDGTRFYLFGQDQVFATTGEDGVVAVNDKPIWRVSDDGQTLTAVEDGLPVAVEEETYGSMMSRGLDE